MTSLSRILGFCRDLIFAKVFGASEAMDAFIIAFKIPNFFRRLFAEGAFTQAFVPVLMAIRKETPAFEQVFIGAVAYRLLLALLVVTALGVIFAPIVILLFAPGYVDQPDQWELTSQLLRFTFPYLACVSLVALAVAVLNSLGQFAMGAFLPVLLNIVLIISALFISPMFEKPIMALAVGVFVAGFLQLWMILRWLRRLAELPKLQWKVSAEVTGKIKTVWRLMLPAIISVSVIQVNLLVDMILASTLPTGSISWLYFAQRLMELPNGLFVVALSTVLLPSFAGLVASGKQTSFSQSVEQAITVGIFLTTPALIGLSVLSEQILSVLFEGGQFLQTDVKATSSALFYYALSLPAFVLIKVFSAAFFANHNTRMPMICAVIAMLVNIALSLWLINLFQHTGLAIATAISAWSNGIMLYLMLRHRQLVAIFKSYGILIRVLICCFIMWLPLILVRPYLAILWQQTEKWQHAALLSATIIIAIAVYLISGLLVRLPFKQWMNWKQDIN